MSSLAPVGSEHAKEVPVQEESIPIPLVHEEITGSTDDLQIVKHPPVVQEWLDVTNALADVHLQQEKILEAYLLAQGGDEAVQLPYTKSRETLVQGQTADHL